MNKKNNTNTAVSLSYDPLDMNAPTVSAIGSGKLAEEMKKIAFKYNVPIKKSSNLANKLSKIQVSEEIPASLYDEVAKVILSTKRPLKITKNK